MKYPGPRLKLRLACMLVMVGKLPRTWNSAGAPRASQTARPRKEPRIRDASDGVDDMLLRVKIDE